ncbi:MAG TPA: DUF6279 family lipoprotein [Burkholderiales bacterium]|nr:DUF6279 family lipoprotein [Burkholderiales bacterium]
MRATVLQMSCGRAARFVLLVALAALLVSCTFTKFAYNQADTVTAWFLDGYFDLDPQQKAEFQKRFERFHAWHRYEQLPEYARFMRTAKTRMQDGVSQEDVLWFREGLRARYRAAARQAAPDAAGLLATITPAQIENLQRKWEKDNRKYVRERKVNGTPDERAEAEGKRIVKHLKEWLAPLTDEQEARVMALARELPRLEQQHYAERLRRQKEFVEVLTHRNEDLQRFTARVTDWMVNWERGRSPEFQRQIDQAWHKRADLFVAVDRMLTPEQRTVSLQRLDTYAADFTQLASARR